MTKPVQMSQEDLIHMAKMHFQLMAETMAELARTSDDGSWLTRMSADVEGVHVSGVIGAETQAARNDY